MTDGPLSNKEWNELKKLTGRFDARTNPNHIHHREWEPGDLTPEEEQRRQILERRLNDHGRR